MGNLNKVSCLGPRGSHSEAAAKSMCEGAEPVLCHSFGEAVEKLLSGETDGAVLPIENSLNGGVGECLDLLEAREIFAVKEFLLSVDHRLAMKAGVRPQDVRVIYSHEQAFGQCSQYLREHFPEAEYVGISSTAECLDRLDGRSAGIVGAYAVREGIVLSHENIADTRGNFTRFLLVERGETPPEHSVMVFFCAVCPHKPGSLVGLLKIFLRYSLNLTRIESRPVKNEFGQYRFFIEFVGDVGNERVQRALSEARAYCRQYKLLGAYS